jgi:hypothetical protein
MRAYSGRAIGTVGRFFRVGCGRINRREKGQRNLWIFPALGHRGCLKWRTPEFRVRKASEAGGGVAFADYVWKPPRPDRNEEAGEDLNRYYWQVDY